MSLQDLLKKIITDSEEKVGEIKSRLEQQKKDMAEEFAKKEKQALLGIDEKTTKALASVDEKIHLMARRTNAKSMLKAKQTVIKSALEHFLRHLEQSESTLYGKILEKLFARIHAKSGKVFAPNSRLEITKKYANPEFEVIPSESIKAGFIFHSGISEIDNTFENLVLSEFREEFTAYFAQQLKLV